MGKRKRSRDRDYEKIMRKIRKLEDKANRHRRRDRSPLSDTDSGASAIEPDLTEQLIHHQEYHDFSEETNKENEQQGISNAVEDELSLDPGILEMLGDDPSTERTFGEELHKDIATRWGHILLNGLQKETKTELLKQYLPSENCPSMQAPKLNLEIKAAINEINHKKDLYNQAKQRQLSSCLAAIGKALNLALTHSDDSMRQMIKPLSDAGRMICDIHYRESQSRRYSIINILNKQTRDTVKNTKIDGFLFGSELAEHLKSSKAISRSGFEMKQSYNQQPRARQLSTVASTRGALNVRGPPRPPAVGEPRARQAGPRQQAYPPPPPPPPPPRARPREPAAAPRATYRHYHQRTRR